VLATHGRSFWVLDDLGPVRTSVGDQPVVLVKPRPVVRYAVNSGFGHKAIKGRNYRMAGPLMFTYRQVEDPRTGDKIDHYLDAAKNPPNGAIISYFLQDKPEDDISLTFLHSDGKEIRTFSSKNPEEQDPPVKPKDPRIPKEAGLNRWTWNLRYPDATKIDDDDVANELVEGAIPGPAVPPGTYTVRLKVGDQTLEQEFEVRKDPRIGASDSGLQAQFDLLKQIHEKLSETHKAINELRAIRRRAEDYAGRSKDKTELEAVARAAQALIDRLKPIEGELIQVNARSRGDVLNFPTRLNTKLAYLITAVSAADGAPTASAREVHTDLSKRVEAQLDQLSETIATEVAFLNQAIQNANLAPVGI
jgi:hypothetical protein